VRSLNLISIGFFRTQNHRLLPNIEYFIDSKWNNNEKIIILKYMKNCTRFSLARGIANEEDYCRFRCKDYNKEGFYYTDGVFLAGRFYSSYRKS
jgi:hypothetical protein